jgi:lysozyme family protein
MDNVYEKDAAFVATMPLILTHEGGFCNRQNDSGGATKYGISLKFLKSITLDDGDLNDDGVVDIKDIELIDIPYANYLYYKYFWVPSHVNFIKSFIVAKKFFDMLVNEGQSQATKLLQRTCNENFDYDKIDVDGVLGPHSLGIINQIDPKALLLEFQHECIEFYNHLVIIHPEDQEFLDGWTKRVWDMGAA